MKVLTFGNPVSSDTTEQLRWLTTSVRAVEQASRDDVETVVADGYSVTGDFDPVRSIDAAGATAVTDTSGGTPDLTVTLAPYTPATAPALAWNGSTDPTAAEATAVNAAFTALNAALAVLNNNVSTLSAAVTTRDGEIASLKALLMTYLQDGRYRGQSRQG